MPSEEGVGEFVEFRRVLEVAAHRFYLARRRNETLRQMRTTPVEMERA
jgi:DNA-binding FadR family transcriptional regulator